MTDKSTGRSASQTMRYEVYDSYTPYSELDSKIQEIIRTQTNGLYISYESTCLSTDGKDVMEVIVARDKAVVVSGASIVAGCALLVVYLGLTYLGVTTSRFFGLDVDRTYLVIAIVRNLLGSWGVWLFAVVAALACVTTAVALVSSAASYFSKLSGGRLSYTVLTVVVCVFSAVVSNFGLEQIISIAAPILNVVYPPALVLILLSFFDHFIKNDWVFRLAALGALLFSLLEVVSGFGLTLPILKLMPLASLGFGWVIPALVCGAVGFLIPSRKS